MSVEPPSTGPSDRTASLSPGDAERAFVAARDRAFGPFRDLVPIGGGAVFRAIDSRDGAAVALKVLASGTFATPDELARFRREQETLARLSHPGIPRLREAGEIEGRPYFATEYVEGEPLSRVLARPDHTFRDPLRAAALLREVCRAMAHAHALGIVHRDLKPSNVVVGTDGRPRVTDFGLARDVVSAEARTRDGQVLGTPAYMAPEQARGEVGRVDARSDVYALGAVLYEMATGRPPFQGASIADVVQRVAHELPPAPREVAPGLPADVEAVCLMAMDPDPSRRYADAGDMAGDLDRLIEGSAPRALSRRLGALRRRFVARHRTAVLVAASVVVTACAVWALAAAVARRPEHSRVAEVPLVLEGLPHGAQVSARRVSPDDMTIAGKAIPVSREGLLPRGGWVIEVRAPGFADLRLPVALEGAARLRVDPVAEADVPEGMVVVTAGAAVFLIDRTEVTRRAYARFLDATGGTRPDAWPQGPLEGDEGLLPATDVSWDEARRYAEWAGRRLPTAEEWEEAGRGIDHRPYPWGRLRTAEAANVETARVEAVGSRPGDASPYGVLDLCGNVMEWTASRWPGEAGFRVICGNSYAHRHVVGPVDLDDLSHRVREPEGFRSPYVGFRCAKDVPRR